MFQTMFPGKQSKLGIFRWVYWGGVRGRAYAGVRSSMGQRARLGCDVVTIKPSVKPSGVWSRDGTFYLLQQ